MRSSNSKVQVHYLDVFRYYAVVCYSQARMHTSTNAAK